MSPGRVRLNDVTPLRLQCLNSFAIERLVDAGNGLLFALNMDQTKFAACGISALLDLSEAVM